MAIFEGFSLSDTCWFLMIWVDTCWYLMIQVLLILDDSWFLWWFAFRSNLDKYRWPNEAFMILRIKNCPSCPQNDPHGLAEPLDVQGFAIILVRKPSSLVVCWCPVCSFKYELRAQSARFFATVFLDSQYYEFHASRHGHGDSAGDPKRIASLAEKEPTRRLDPGTLRVHPWGECVCGPICGDVLPQRSWSARLPLMRGMPSLG